MKNIITIIGLLILLSACNNILEEDPERNKTSVEFYKTSEDALLAVNAVYRSLSTDATYAPGTILDLVELSTDDVTIGPNPASTSPEFGQLEDYTFTPSNSRFFNIWSELYKGINRANLVIDNVPPISMDETLKSRILGEARFLRAFYYFHLVRLFGDVPLITASTKSLEDSNLNPSRAPKVKVYEQIEEDLMFAEKTLYSTYTNAQTDIGRATIGAAKSLLAKVYLTQQKWSQAAAKANEVISSNVYSLWADYGDNFKIANEHLKESIFEAQFSRDGAFGTKIFINIAPRNSTYVPSTAGGNGRGNYVPTKDIFDKYQEGDRRKEVNFLTSYIQGSTTVNVNPPHIKKYEDINTQFEFSDNNWPILRYADVLLMYAESVNENSGPNEEAYKYLNMVRRRAFKANLNDISIYDYSAGLSKEEFREKLYEERRLELFFEGHRWFDLVRTGMLVNKVKAEKPTVAIQEYHTQYPIPQNERDINSNLTPQNTGY